MIPAETGNRQPRNVNSDKESGSASGGTRLKRWILSIWEPTLAVPIALGLGLRLLLIPWFSDPYNFFGTYIATDILLRGIEPLQVLSGDAVFGELNPWGYPALYFSFTLLARAASLGDPFLYGVWLKIPMAILDVGTSLLLFHIARLIGASLSTARLASMAFLFNPFSILITSIWGVNDPIPVFFTVLAFYFLLRKRERDLSYASVSLGIGIALKLYPVLLLPAILAKAGGARRKLQSLLMALAIPAVTSLPFLLTSGSTYLAVLFRFASGAEGAGLDPQRSILSGVSWLVGPLDPRIALLPAVALVLVLWWVYQATRNRRMHPLLGGAVALLASYILTVRWIPNYALWAVPFTTLQALLFTRGWRRWIPSVFWAPTMADASIHMGWYPTPFSGASGVPYWALVANGPAIITVNLFPLGVLIVLTATFLAATAATLYLALRKEPDTETKVEAGPQSRPARRTRGLPSGSLCLLILLALLGGTVAGGYYQHIQRGAVTPEDFASFTPQSDGVVVVHDDFRARFLSFRWTFNGSGRYVLDPNGTGGIILDTVGPSRTAALEDPVETDTLEVRFTFRLRGRYGVGPMVLARGPGGWLGVTGPSLESYLDYYDEISNQFITLGRIEESWYEATLLFGPDRREVRIASGTLVLGGGGQVKGLRLGHDLPTPGGGGVLEISEVSLRWSIGPKAPEGPPLWTVALSGVGAIAASYVGVGGIPSILRRRQPRA